MPHRFHAGRVLGCDDAFGPGVLKDRVYGDLDSNQLSGPPANWSSDYGVFDPDHYADLSGSDDDYVLPEGTQSRRAATNVPLQELMSPTSLAILERTAAHAEHRCVDPRHAPPPPSMHACPPRPYHASVPTQTPTHALAHALHSLARSPTHPPDRPPASLLAHPPTRPPARLHRSSPTRPSAHPRAHVPPLGPCV